MSKAASVGTVVPASNDKDKKECVTVVLRCRPLNSKEKKENRKPIVHCNIEDSSVTITNPKPNQGKAGKEAQRSFTFDSVFDENSKQLQVYDEVAYPLVESVISGYNGTIFAYGQTGCGKTHTMMGPEIENANPDDLGIIPNSFENIFEEVRIGSEGDEGKEYLVQASYLEIYNEKIRDLLIDSPEQNLQLREDKDKGVFVHGLKEIVVESVESIKEIMVQGAKNRTVGETAMNRGSSRSHSIFTVRIESTKKNAQGEESFRVGKLNLVDLAGSERQKKTKASGKRLKEGSSINLSLSALGNVIAALVDGKSGKHIPYRDSKLTRLLQTSLGGNTKTVMIAAIGPADYNYEETLSTLRYANRAKNIKNKPTINEDPKDAMLRAYKDEIEILKRQLQDNHSRNPSPSQEESGSAQQAALSELQTRLTEQQQEISRQLKEAEERAKLEREQREELQKKLAEMQAKVIGKDGVLASPRRDNSAVSKNVGGSEKGVKRTCSTADLETVIKRAQARKKKHNAMVKKKEKLRQERAKRAKQVKEARKEAKSAAEALQVVEQICAEKIAEAEQEVKDLAHEFNAERSSFLQNITELQQEKQLFQQIVELYVHKSELKRIWDVAQWDANMEKWILPEAGTSQGENLPKLNVRNNELSEKGGKQRNSARGFKPKSSRRRKQKRCDNNESISAADAEISSIMQKGDKGKVEYQGKEPGSAMKRYRRQRLTKAYEPSPIPSKKYRSRTGRGLLPRTPKRDAIAPKPNPNKLVSLRPLDCGAAKPLAKLTMSPAALPSPSNSAFNNRALEPMVPQVDHPHYPRPPGGTDQSDGNRNVQPVCANI